MNHKVELVTMVTTSDNFRSELQSRMIYVNSEHEEMFKKIG